MIPVLIATVAPVLVLLPLAVFCQPIMPARHRDGVRATRIVRRLSAERARVHRPTGWESPAWTVQPREVPA